MSFTGDLEHLPIVDVIQLLHATRKSGILRVKCRKGESQLVFKDGYMVSANHLNNSVRIGKILSDLNLVTQEMLDQALQEQAVAGPDRKPLIITLLEKGEVKEEDAYKGLERLIEMTIVEILTWKRGTFVLDVLPQGIGEDYQYYPDKLGREINIDTQSVLMDALRIYDEKMRDGELHEEDFEDDATAGPDDSSPGVSADDLGLADFDLLEEKIPAVFKSLDQEGPSKLHSRLIEEISPELSLTDRESLASFLGSFASAPTDGETHREGPPQPVIFLSSDELVRHSLTTVCKHAGFAVFATDDKENIDPIIAQSLPRNIVPLLVFDTPHDPFTSDVIISLQQQKKSRYPRIVMIQLYSGLDSAFPLEAYRSGVSAVLPRPVRQHGEETFIVELIAFLQVFKSYMEERAREQEYPWVQKLTMTFKGMRDLNEPPEIATAMLQFVGGIFDRAVTLIVRDAEIILEKSIGIRGENSRVTQAALGTKIPLSKPSLFNKVLDEGSVFYGNSEDDSMVSHVFNAIGAPAHATILLLPILNRGKVVAITYADFGDKEVSTFDVEALEILAAQAELVLDNALYRKKLLKN